MKQQKSKEYAEANYKTEIWQKEAVKCYEAGWDEALKSQWVNVKERQPEPNELVLCRMVSNGAIVSGYIYLQDDKYRVATSPNFEFEDYGYYECDCWMPIPSFGEILKSNVMKRLKGE